MRTTVRLDNDVFQAVQTLASLAGRTVDEFVEDALRKQLALGETSQRNCDLPFRTDGRGGLRPGVSLDRSASLANLMDDVNEAS